MYIPCINGVVRFLIFASSCRIKGALGLNYKGGWGGGYTIDIQHPKFLGK